MKLDDIEVSRPYKDAIMLTTKFSDGITHSIKLPLNSSRLEMAACLRIFATELYNFTDEEEVLDMKKQLT